MNKRGLGIGLLMFTGALWFWLRLDQANETSKKADVENALPSVFPTLAENKIKTITFNNDVYRYTLFKNNGEAMLVANYEAKDTAINISEILRCKNGINGGFYDENGKALGWVKSEGKIIAGTRKSSLLNGYLSVLNGKWIIGRSVPEKSENGVQSGPVLLENNQPVNLTLAGDKLARRMFAAVTEDGDGYFGSVIDEATFLMGPNLFDLPEIIRVIEKNEGLDWNFAINLDGGLASAYKDGDFWLEEISPIGSWWCFK